MRLRSRSASFEGQAVTVAIQDFAFQGNARARRGRGDFAGVSAAIERATPFLIFTTSGGARMQEGMFALAQMVRTDGRRAASAGGEASLYCHPDQSNNGRRDSVLRHARRRAYRRAWGRDWLRRRPGDRADDTRAPACGLPNAPNTCATMAWSIWLCLGPGSGRRLRNSAVAHPRPRRGSSVNGRYAWTALRSARFRPRFYFRLECLSKAVVGRFGRLGRPTENSFNRRTVSWQVQQNGTVLAGGVFLGNAGSDSPLSGRDPRRGSATPAARSPMRPTATTAIMPRQSRLSSIPRGSATARFSSSSFRSTIRALETATGQ